MIDLAKLAAKGRAFSGARPWSDDELTALINLETSRGISREVAADYIRNGILTLEDYDRAVAADFKPMTLQEASQQADAALRDHSFVTKATAPKAVSDGAKKSATPKKATKAAKKK